MWLRNHKKEGLYVGLKKEKLLFVLIGCTLLVGCRKETKVEEQQTNISDNAITIETDKMEDTEVTDSPDEDVTIISVLGIEELIIENNRIYGDEAAVGCLDNRFTPEEIDTILNAIEGAWSVDEYVGFVPYETGTWPEEEGTEDEKREKYETAVEQAEENSPDFSFWVKNHNGEGSDNCGHYIYVHSDNKTYASPINIALSMQAEGDCYSEFINRTTQGAGVSQYYGYPVIYIEFFSVSCSEEGTVSYEPATLILASDGSFLLLKDDAFYSLTNSIQGTIMSGDFSCLEDEDWESMQKDYDWGMNELELYEWSQLDLNGDGIEDLILQRKKALKGWEHKLILGIFVCEKDRARCILWDTADNSEYYFCGPTGELMYTASSYVPIVSKELYRHCYYDRDWNLITDFELVVCRIDAKEYIEEYPQQIEEWKQENPDMAEDGIYYRKYTEEGVEILTREEMENIYEMETGYEFQSVFYK